MPVESVLIDPMVQLDQRDYEVFGNDSNDIPAAVQDWEV